MTASQVQHKVAFRDDAKRQFPAKLQPEDVPFHSRITDLTDA